MIYAVLFHLQTCCNLSVWVKFYPSLPFPLFDTHFIPLSLPLMECKPAPLYANVFMARNIDEELHKIAEKYTENGQIPMKYMKRFVDDIFLIFIGTIENLQMFLKRLIHPTQIKSSLCHTPLQLQANASHPDTNAHKCYQYHTWTHPANLKEAK